MRRLRHVGVESPYKPHTIDNAESGISLGELHKDSFNDTKLICSLCEFCCCLLRQRSKRQKISYVPSVNLPEIDERESEEILRGIIFGSFAQILGNLAKHFLSMAEAQSHAD